MRITLTALALLAAACTPPASQDAPPAPAAESAPAPVNPETAALGATPATGAWSFAVDEGTHAAGFGAPESEYQFVIVCEAGSGNLRLTYEHELSPDQNTTLRLITAVQSIELPARSFNEGLPSVTAEIADADPAKPLLIGMLGAPTDRFAAEVAGVTQVFPWSDEIAQALTACR